MLLLAALLPHAACGYLCMMSMPAIRTDVDTLDHPFTLVYDFTVRDLRTKAMKDKQLADDTANLQKQVDADQMTPDQMKDQIAAEKLAMAQTSKPGKLTISYDGTTLLVDDAHPKDEETVQIIRTGRTYMLWPRNPDTAGQGFSTLVSYGILEVPIVGPSLPFLPVSQDGKVLVSAAFDDHLDYRPGQLKRAKNGAIVRVQYGSDKRSDSMDLSGHKLFQAQWIAKTIDWKIPFVHREMRYTLVKAEPSAMASDSFDPGHYLSDGTGVQLNLGNNKSASFKYVKSKGSFDDQANAAWNGGQ